MYKSNNLLNHRIYNVFITTVASPGKMPYDHVADNANNKFSYLRPSFRSEPIKLKIM